MRRSIVVCVVLMSAPLTASADIIGVSGDFTVMSAATASYVANAYNDPSPAPIRIWTEQDTITLISDLLLDTDLADPTLRYVTGAAGVGEVAFPPGGGPIVAAGTAVSVYYSYFDPVSDSARGTVTFDTPVLGIVAFTSRLQFSDFLRVPGAPYPGSPAFGNRGWEDAEWAQLSADRLTLEFFGNAASPGDQFRIVTAAAAAVPEPATWLLLLSGATLALRRRL